MIEGLPVLLPLLSKADLDKIHSEALTVLNTVGLAVSNEEALKRLKGCKEIQLRDGRVYPDPEFVDDLVEKQRKEVTRSREPSFSKEIVLAVGSHAANYVDIETDRVRKFDVQSLIDATKLVDALHDWNVVGGTPGYPPDLPPMLQAPTQFMISAMYSRYGGRCAASTTFEAMEYIRRMSEVMGQGFGVGMHMISPFKMEGNEFDLLMQYIDSGCSLSVASMPIIGVSAPIEILQAFVMSVAEVLGGFAILSLLSVKNKVSFSINAYAFDMKYATLVYGSPEQNLCDAIQFQINQYYGHSRGSIATRSIRSMADQPGIQAAAERGASAVFGALLGSRTFSGAGLLSLDEVFSMEQLVIDCEIRDYAQRIIQGLDLQTLDTATQIITEVLPKDDFLSDQSTLSGYRQTYWIPRLFHHASLHQRQAKEVADLRQEAKQMVRDRIAQHIWEIESSKRQEIERIYREACEKLR